MNSKRQIDTKSKSTNIKFQRKGNIRQTIKQDDFISVRLDHSKILVTNYFITKYNSEMVHIKRGSKHTEDDI